MESGEAVCIKLLLINFTQNSRAFTKQNKLPWCLREAQSEYQVNPIVFFFLQQCIVTIESHVKYPTKEFNYQQYVYIAIKPPLVVA